ncbi:D-alanyl-D-alanine carboxypeptidase [Mesorhizobium soli]|uniref:D-alanyl-D-alanine carboxypeptidase n=1 Tax=Pseudaminobacter soli (ex Li et al. 2025) TaxID=1295366 RepID=UPI002476FD7F|nr:D-alanyl-D-alanine carboxypeptidase [Mesorhizobium soli]MDH6229459.1 D-alanyl-D-alanine carboxypeptidase [Mesorhizobium soli]
MRQAFAGIALKQYFSAKSAIATILAVVMSVVSVGVANAAAKKSNTKYAAIVVDANTGKMLFSANADSRRFPASLTKMMTLYLTFEALSRGKITKETRVPFSAHAASQPPTKLGVRAGGSVSVETAIYALVTKSANDASTALAELIAGDEETFARMMTAKARSLGMTGTVFRNANGLPNPGQFTTARDMSTLGLALREHYPQYYGYFSTRSFTWGRARMPNHNHLLGRVKGMDGIKTGYTNASGFNLVSSVIDGNRRIVAVVMGGASGGARDNHMVELIQRYLPQASNGGKRGQLVARAESSPSGAIAKVLLPKNAAPTPDAKPDGDVDVAVDNDEEKAPVKVADAAPAKATEHAKTPETVPAPALQAYAEPAPFQRADTETDDDAEDAPAPTVQHVDPVKTASVSPTGWVVQIASAPSREGAEAILDKTTKQAGGVLARASGFTVQFEKGGVTYHRARFGGFQSKVAAWDACTALKKKKISCYAVQN